MNEKISRDRLINSLREISPMPDDENLTEVILSKHEEIVNALRPVANEDCIEPLIASFGYGDAFEGYWPVVHILESLPEQPLRQALLRSLDQGGDGARMWSALMLGRQRDERDVPVLINALNDPRELVRVNAVIALGAIGTDDARKAVKSKSHDPSVKVREWVNEVLRKLDQ
jgi:hypothetical protein